MVNDGDDTTGEPRIAAPTEFHNYWYVTVHPAITYYFMGIGIFGVCTLLTVINIAWMSIRIF